MGHAIDAAGNRPRRYNEFVSEPSTTPLASPAASSHVELPPPALSPAHDADASGPGWIRIAVLVLSVAAAGAGWMAWQTNKRVQSLEQELVRRQQDSQGQATEARVLARQAQELSREAAARTTLLETRLTEVALQRSQVEDLIKTLSLSRDENLVFDIEAGLRVASQQTALTGSAEPLIAALQSADDRLARARQPRLDNIRRALAKDLDRVRATRVIDINTLTIRLDEAARLVDEVPLLNQSELALATVPATRAAAGAKDKAPPASASGAASAPESGWRHAILDWGKGAAQTVWTETRSLVRITRIQQPEAMLLAPDQAFFLRENIKLRLLNARLALMSRQSAQAAADLRLIERSLPRYFDPQSRKTQLLQSMVTDAIAQSQQTTVPRPDDTLAALATVAAAAGGGR
ncbi:MAG: uroporphyrinogen-III C-methyltransferase [Burkholderiales bacterium]|nr:uroporphyrinogen-III C-methyltransferase [Burkholderiales bacterium]